MAHSLRPTQRGFLFSLLGPFSLLILWNWTFVCVVGFSMHNSMLKSTRKMRWAVSISLKLEKTAKAERKKIQIKIDRYRA